MKCLSSTKQTHIIATNSAPWREPSLHPGHPAPCYQIVWFKTTSKENTFPGLKTRTNRGEMQILPNLPQSHAFSPRLPPLPTQHLRAECGGRMRQAGTCFPRHMPISRQGWTHRDARLASTDSDNLSGPADCHNAGPWHLVTRRQHRQSKSNPRHVAGMLFSCAICTGSW